MAVNAILYDNQMNKFPEIYQDYLNFKSKITKEDSENSIEAVPIFNRLNGFAERMKSREYATAFGIGTLAVLNGPEELDDLVSAYKQILKTYKQPYDGKIAQHPFSFFRGSILEKYINPNSPFCPDTRFAKWLIGKDKTLLQTKFGDWFIKTFKIKVKEIPTELSDITNSEKIPTTIFAKQFITKNKFAEMTARALTRTPILSAYALLGIEALHIAHASESTEDIFKETTKSAVSLATTLIASGYAGAIGAKHCGPIGALIGMGLSAILGCKVSKALS